MQASRRKSALHQESYRWIDYYKSVDQESSLFLTMDSQTSSPPKSLYLDGVMPWGGASRRGGDNTSCIVTHVFSPPLLRAPSPLRPGTIRAAPSLSSSSTSSPRHAGIAGLSNTGQAPCTRPSGPREGRPFCLSPRTPCLGAPSAPLTGVRRGSRAGTVSLTRSLMSGSLMVCASGAAA